MVHGNEVQGTVLSVDVRDELRDLSLKLGGIRERGRRDLDKDNFALPLWIVLEKLLKSAQLS